jgi:hypothetical protein
MVQKQETEITKKVSLPLPIYNIDEVNSCVCSGFYSDRRNRFKGQ